MNHSTLRWGMLYTQHSGAEGAGPTPSPMMRNEGGGGVLGSRVLGTRGDSTTPYG